MKERRKTVWVPGEDIARYSALLSREPSCEEECLGEDHTITFTADFGGGMEMDIKVCGVQYREGESNSAWSEAVLFKNGCEVCCSEPEDFLEGEWSLAHEGTAYTARIAAAPAKLGYSWTTLYSSMSLFGEDDMKAFIDAVAGSEDAPEDILAFIKKTRSAVDRNKVRAILNMAWLDIRGAAVCLPLFSGSLRFSLEEIERKRKIILGMLAPFIKDGCILYEEYCTAADAYDTPALKGYLVENGELQDKKPVLTWNGIYFAGRGA